MCVLDSTKASPFSNTSASFCLAMRMCEASPPPFIMRHILHNTPPTLRLLTQSIVILEVGIVGQDMERRPYLLEPWCAAAAATAAATATGLRFGGTFALTLTLGAAFGFTLASAFAASLALAFALTASLTLTVN